MGANTGAKNKYDTFAPAKINLYLHVLGKRNDGYHELESLVVFADFGDTLTLDCTQPLGLSLETIDTEFLLNPIQNLVLQATSYLQALKPDLRTGHFHLTKRIPVAAGLGGGSADAGAALRLLAMANNIALSDPVLMQAAAKTGADVLVCLFSQPRVMYGVGEQLGDVLAHPPSHAVLVNPRCFVATADIFKALAVSNITGAMDSSITLIPEFMDNTLLSSWLRQQRNDLQPVACKVQPLVANVLTVLSQIKTANLVRMSGSGATCFALFTSTENAQNAAKYIKSNYPNWWVQPVQLSA